MILTVLIVFFIPSILLLLLPKKHWLRFYLCYLQYTMISTALPTILIPLRFNMKLHDKVLTFLATLSFKLLSFEWIFRNKKYFEKYNSAIIVVNHQSIFDAAGIVLMNEGFAGMTATAKKGLKYIPILGQILQLEQAIFIDRKKTKESFNSMINTIRRLQDRKIIIFPEGTRNKNKDGFLDFKYGAFRIAIELQLPIIPVVISPYLFLKSGKEFSGDDPKEQESLTPNHFLLGSSSGSGPLLKDTGPDLRKRWREAQGLTCLFWKRWTREYLPTLVKSTRWFSGSPSSYVGQLVYLPEKGAPGRWARGRIVATYPGKDVKTEAGVIRRAITSLLPLINESPHSLGVEDVRGEH